MPESTHPPLILTHAHNIRAHTKQELLRALKGHITAHNKPSACKLMRQVTLLLALPMLPPPPKW